jgi:hypothetical protein
MAMWKTALVVKRYFGLIRQAKMLGVMLVPIRPENRARYPKDWKQISLRIRTERSGGTCECVGECGDHLGRRCDARNYAPHPVTQSKVVLTVAHLDHTPENCHDSNLVAMCQRCHNKYDAPMRRAGIKARKHADNAVADMFDRKDD